MADASIKKAAAAQLQKYGNVDINQAVREQEVSVGGAEWGLEERRFGMSLRFSFENSTYVYRGRLHLYDVETGRSYTIDTRQADSEMLLVEDETVYYRVSNRLYSAPITGETLGPAKLLATDEAIRDAHWAFTKR
jgi:hypothetical protein